jgi:hypothetical protein
MRPKPALAALRILLFEKTYKELRKFDCFGLRHGQGMLEQSGLHRDPVPGDSLRNTPGLPPHSRGIRGQALPFDRAYRLKAAYRVMLEEPSAERAPAH